MIEYVVYNPIYTQIHKLPKTNAGVVTIPVLIIDMRQYKRMDEFEFS